MRYLGALAAAAATTIAIDQAGKALVRANVPEGHGRDIPGVPYLKLAHVENHGISLGLPGLNTLMYPALAGGVALLGAHMQAHGSAPLLTAIGTGLMVGGGISNTVDRVSHGSVTDFIGFPGLFTNNPADLAITGGAIALSVAALRR